LYLIPDCFISSGFTPISKNSGAGDTQTLTLSTTEHDFGGVTPGNSVAPLELKIGNGSTNRSARKLSITDIVLSDTDNFDLNLNGGSAPCESLAPSLAAGKSCTVTIAFTPPPNADASYSATLTIKSEDRAVTSRVVKLKAIAEPVTAIKVNISQVESDDACPSALITAYVAVTDQWDFPVRGLTETDFEISENSVDKSLLNVYDVEQDTDHLSVVLVMDYSGSISNNPDAKADLEEAATELVNGLGPDDEAEIIKFGSEVTVMQEFTSDKALLRKAITTDPSFGKWTRLYDAVWLGINDVNTKGSNVRKAVVLLSDGKDIGPDDKPLSDKTIDQVIEDAQANGISGIPIFTIGLGNFNTDPLKEMADETGGIFYESSESENLDTIYEQIADLLFTDQYVLKYESALADGDDGDLKIKAIYSTPITDTDTRSITPCPNP
jgi:Ca-activated chloride channel family protein